jgi:hypothetical protein
MGTLKDNEILVNRTGVRRGSRKWVQEQERKGGGLAVDLLEHQGMSWALVRARCPASAGLLYVLLGDRGQVLDDDCRAWTQGWTDTSLSDAAYRYILERLPLEEIKAKYLEDDEDGQD